MDTTVQIAIISAAASICAGVITFILNKRAERKLAEHKASLSEHCNRALEDHKSELKAKEATHQTRWEIKRDACLDAFAVIDGHHSNVEWKYKVESQEKPKVEDARRCYN